MRHGQQVIRSGGREHPLRWTTENRKCEKRPSSLANLANQNYTFSMLIRLGDLPSDAAFFTEMAVSLEIVGMFGPDYGLQ
jgi:hypothetical protein